MRRFLNWLSSLNPNNCPVDTAEGEAALAQARQALLDEENRSRAAKDLANRALLSRQHNHYAQALEQALGGRF